jgi:hypothetical protein
MKADEENVLEMGGLGEDERVKILVLQNIKLYKQWTKENESLKAGLEKQEKMLELFTQKLNKFDQLEAKVRSDLVAAIANSSKVLLDDIREKIGNSATSSVDQTARELKSVVSDASHALTRYKEETQGNQTRNLLMTIGVAIASSLLIVWFLIPKPILPLTWNMLQTYFHGEILEDTWASLPDKTRKEFIEVARQKTGMKHPLSDLSSAGNGNDGGGQQSGDAANSGG